MKLLKPYEDINETMRYVKVQIVDSIPFALKTCPEFDSPRELFYWLKDQVEYQEDPPGYELLQTMQTLFRTGYGDCDCFTIAAVACMIANNWDNISIDLVGRSKLAPVHIYSDIIWQGERCVLDLTNFDYDQERDGYKYIQRLPVNWRQWK